MKEIMRILIGSQNYNLASPESDEDYKVIFIPDFDDLYRCHIADNGDLAEDCHNEHYAPLDVRKWFNLMLKGNPNAIETLYSTKITITSNITSLSFPKALEYIRELYKEHYVVLVWPTFFAATKGLVFNSIKRYGINRKTASRAVYFINLLRYIMRNDFIITEETWRNSSVCNLARELRFNEKLSLPNEETLHYLFDTIEEDYTNNLFSATARFTGNACNTLAFHKNAIEQYLKTFIKEEMN